MDWYYYIALAAILSQLVFLYQCHRNYRYALVKYKKKRLAYRPRAVLIVPCKGLDPAFQENIASFFSQDYENYLLWFVVADKSDPAYEQLCKLKNQLRLYCYQRIGDDVEILAFADSDICVRSDWLSHIVWPLRKSKNGAASGYRWFIPKNNNLASLALSAVNAKIAQLLGNTHFNQAWGGSVAIRVEVFRQVGLDKIWPKALSDDLSLSCAVKKARKKIVFVPACLVASYVSATWAELFEFGRRQFLITRISAPRAWWFGLFSSLYSVLGLWAGAGLAVYAATIGEKNLPLFAAVPILFFIGQFIRAVLRQKMANELLKYERQATSDERRAMKAAMAADILASWLWSLLLLSFIISSAFGRTITWRGIRYNLLSPTETVILDR